MRFMAIPRYAMSVNANSFIDAWSDRHSPEQSGGKRRARHDLRGLSARLSDKRH
jgi:hypothetical protein